jgi:hypothetical protein
LPCLARYFGWEKIVAGKQNENLKKLEELKERSLIIKGH